MDLGHRHQYWPRHHTQNHRPARIAENYENSLTKKNLDTLHDLWLQEILPNQVYQWI